MITHNIFICGEIKKILIFLVCKKDLKFRAMAKRYTFNTLHAG